MFITQVTVSYQRTESLGNYSNVKPGISLTAALSDDDDPAAVQAALMAEARKFVHAEIDDALEHDGGRPKFYDGPRFSLKRNSHRQVIVIFPHQLDLNTLPDPDRWWSIGFSGVRLEAARRLAAQETPGWPVVDCSDGDLSRLPPVPEGRPEPNPGWDEEDDQGYE